MPAKMPAKIPAKKPEPKKPANEPHIGSQKEITFADVDDSMGIYLDLAQFTKRTKLPFDMDKLYANARTMQEEMEFGKSSAVKKSFSSTSAIRVIMNEFRRIYAQGLRSKYTVQPVNDNVYHLRMKFDKDFFDKSSQIYTDIIKYNKNVEIDIQIDSKLYPFYPPKVRLICPRLLNHMNGRIATMECLLLSKWSPLFTIETVIHSHFKKLMDRYGQIDASSDSYDDLENDLIELSLLSEIPARINSFLSIEELKNIKENHQSTGSAGTSNQKWASGTGYGHAGLKEWDIKSTLKAKEERDKQLSRCIKNITKRLTKIIMNNINVDAVEILKNSCYVPYLKSVFFGNNVLELLKNTAQFELLLNSLRILTNKFVPIFTLKDAENKEKSLHEIFGDLNNDCVSYLVTMKKMSTGDLTNEIKAEMDLVSNFASFYKKIDREIKQQMRTNAKNNKSLSKPLLSLSLESKSLSEIYRTELAGEVCKPYESMNISAFEKLMREAAETNKQDNKFVTTASVRHIAKELLSHSRDLPLDLGSSIFYRFSPENVKYHEFIIAAPEDTPYDSGCFHFRMYCPATYPQKCPKVNIYTTGGGTIRFNPNLYECGKVCLSILGTWDAQAGESWMPGTSTMRQVMVSIQSLVMIPDPYFNEPGYEREYGTETGKKHSHDYNQRVRLGTMKWAMVDQMKNPTPGFEEAIKKHFKLKADHVKKTCAAWVSEAPASLIPEFKATYTALCAQLDKLTGQKTDVSQVINMPATTATTTKKPIKAIAAKAKGKSKYVNV